MAEATYLEGALSYPKETIEEYTARGWWDNSTYGDVLDRSAARCPDKIAVVDERSRPTYAQLKDKADRFAIALLKLGVKKYDRILIQLPNRYEFLVSFYAMHRIGAVPFIAIPRHEYREVSHFFNLAEPVGWILPVRDGSREFVSLINEVRPQAKSLKYLIMLEDGETLPPGALSMEKLVDEVKLENYPPDYLAQFRPDPNDVAMLLPTGGTTGLPKAVPRTHNSFLVRNKYSSRDVTSDDVQLLATPIGHAMALQGPVNGAILKGATLVLVNVPRPKEILEAIEREKVTHATLVPAQVEGILSYPDLAKYDLRSLKLIGTSAAALPAEIARKAIDFFGSFGCTFKGGSLGSSEGTYASISPDDPPDKKLTTVGRAIAPGDCLKVIDDEERELPSNNEGELVSKGPGVFTGYYKAPEENKQVFTQDGYFRTGDLAKIDEQGYVSITGRKKDIIRRGGETIIPSEIENILYSHPDIKDVAVVGMPDPQMGERACAYVVPKPGKTISFDDMISFLKSKGASVLLLPERLEIIDELPLTGVGKMDKKALRKDIEEKLRKEGVLKG
jgi:2,3-dihydroxybenzoate-AMP ligase